MALVGIRLLKRSLALRDGDVVPILRVNVPCDESVLQVLHEREDVASKRPVGRTQVGRSHIEDVGERSIQFRHLEHDGAVGEVGQVFVAPGVGGDLVAGIVDGFEGVDAVVDAVVQGACHEEGGFGAGGFEVGEDFFGVVVRAVVEC